MTSVHFATIGNGLGHMTRPLVVADALRSAEPQIDITFAGGGHYAALISQCGFEHIPSEPLWLRRPLASTAYPGWQPGDDVDDDPDQHLRDLAFLMNEVAAGFKRALPEDRAFLRDRRPDVVVTDHRWSMVVACAEAGVPCLGLTHVFVTRHRSTTSPDAIRLVDETHFWHHEFIPRASSGRAGPATSSSSWRAIGRCSPTSPRSSCASLRRVT